MADDGWRYALREDWEDSSDNGDAWFDEEDSEMYAGEEPDEDDYEESAEEQHAAQDAAEDLEARGHPETQRTEQSSSSAPTDAPGASTGTGRKGTAYGRTKKFLDALKQLPHSEVQRRMCDIIDYMATQGFDVATFWHFFTYQLSDVQTASRITYARAGVVGGGLLEGSLDRLDCPPRRRAHGSRRPKGARDVTRPWSVKRVKKTVNKEMRALRTVFESPLEEISEEMLLSVTLPDLIKEVKERSPVLWDLLLEASTTPRQRDRNSYKNPEPVRIKKRSLASNSTLTYNIFSLS